MHRRIISFYLLFFLTFLIAADSDSHRSTDQLKADSKEIFLSSYDFIHALPVREEGSPEEAEVFRYIEDFASERDFTTEYQSLDGREDMHSFSSNLLVRIPGTSDRTLILAVPVDSYIDDSDEGINPALALAFMNEWVDRAVPVNLIFLFTSADSQDRGFLGSQSFLNQMSFSDKTAFLYLLMDNRMETSEIKGSTVFRTSPGWYMETLRKTLTVSGIKTSLDASGFLINRAGLPVDSLPLGNYLDEDIPAAALVSSGAQGPDLTGQSDQWLRFLHSLCASFKQDFPSEWESNYIYWGWNKDVFFYLSEKAVLITIVTILSLSLILLLVHVRKIHLNFKRFRRHFWAVPVIVYLVFTFYMTATLFLEELLIMSQHPDQWMDIPMYFLLLKFLIALLFSSLFINLLRGLPFPRTPHFYSYLAFISGLINISIVCFLNISFAPVLLINQLFIFLFILSRSLNVKRIALSLSLVPQLLLLSYLFNRDYTTVFHFFLLSRVEGNWFLSSFSLPVLCLFLAQNNYHHHYARSRQEMKSAIFTLAEAVLVIFMVFYTFQLPRFNEGDHQIIRLNDDLNLDTGIRDLKISSDREMGDAVLAAGDKTIPVPPGIKDFKIQGETPEDLLSFDWETREFLDRRSIDLNIYTKNHADQIQMEIHSDDRLVLYDSLYPYEVSPDQKSISISIGINPPNPLNMPLIFSGDSQPEILIKVLNDSSEYSLIPDNKDTETVIRSTIIKSLPFDSLKTSGSFNRNEPGTESAQ